MVKSASSPAIYAMDADPIPSTAVVFAWVFF
jgi:hypothetical protein